MSNGGSDRDGELAGLAWQLSRDDPRLARRLTGDSTPGRRVSPLLAATVVTLAFAIALVVLGLMQNNAFLAGIGALGLSVAAAGAAADGIQRWTRSASAAKRPGN